MGLVLSILLAGKKNDINTKTWKKILNEKKWLEEPGALDVDLGRFHGPCYSNKKGYTKRNSYWLNQSNIYDRNRISLIFA